LSITCDSALHPPARQGKCAATQPFFCGRGVKNERSKKRVEMEVEVEVEGEVEVEVGIARRMSALGRLKQNVHQLLTAPPLSPMSDEPHFHVQGQSLHLRLPRPPQPERQHEQRRVQHVKDAVQVFFARVALGSPGFLGALAGAVAIC
jgi:hypothetical protein